MKRTAIKNPNWSNRFEGKRDYVVKQESERGVQLTAQTFKTKADAESWIEEQERMDKECESQHGNPKP